MRFRGDFYSPVFHSQACRRHSPPAEAPTANNKTFCIIDSIHFQWDDGLGDSFDLLHPCSQGTPFL